MLKIRGKKYILIASVAISCVIMGLVDAVIQPTYIVKSAVKIALFLIIPFFYGMCDKECNLKKLFVPCKKGVLTAFFAGIAIYSVIIAAYFAFKNIFDFSLVTTALGGNLKIDANNFIWVAIYISFVNSLLEEFFFRGFAFFNVKRLTSRRFAYIFSALAFALYHIAMMIGWFGIEVIALAIVGLVIGGVIFNFVNEKSENIYTSWLIHMFANFAINTVGFILFSVG